MCVEDRLSGCVLYLSFEAMNIINYNSLKLISVIIDRAKLVYFM